MYLAVLLSVASAGEARADERIISLTPAITETLFALGAGSEVVGVSEYSDTPAGARKLPRVGSFLDPNFEAIVALRPTLIVTTALSSNLRTIRTLQELGYSVLMVRDSSVEDIRNAIGQIGARIGRVREAVALLAEMSRQFSSVRRCLVNVKPRTVLMIVGHEPIVAVGKGVFLDQLIAIAGGENVADTTALQWPRLDIEYIIAMRPEVILDGQMGDERTRNDGFWSHYSMIPAVLNHRVYGYPSDRFIVPGPELGRSLVFLAERIHPEAFSANSGLCATLPDAQMAVDPQ
jgi:iron complex transport system substrate-binding protein